MAYGDWLTPGGQTPDQNLKRELADIGSRLNLLEGGMAALQTALVSTQSDMASLTGRVADLETNQALIAETVEGIGVVHLVDADPPDPALGVEGDLAISRVSGTAYERMADDATPVWVARWVLPSSA